MRVHHLTSWTLLVGLSSQAGAHEKSPADSVEEAGGIGLAQPLGADRLGFHCGFKRIFPLFCCDGSLGSPESDGRSLLSWRETREVAILSSRETTSAPFAIATGRQRMLIRDVLRMKNRTLVTVRPGASVAQAVGLLDSNNIGSLPVVDEEGRLCGIFSERDVLIGLHRTGEDFCRQPIASVMTRDVATCTPEDSVHDAMGRMGSRGVGQLPVLINGEVAGIVSAGDLLRALHQATEEENKHLIDYVHGTY